MIRPKTYGEFAEMNEYTRVDERLRDREISDDAWRILNLHNEIPDVVKKHFDMQDVTVSYVDYYDDNNVAIVASTKDCYEPIRMSAIVGDKFEASVDCLLESDRWDVEFDKSADDMFDELQGKLISGVERDNLLREQYDRPRYEHWAKMYPESDNETLRTEPWKYFRHLYYSMPEDSEWMFLERLHRQMQNRFDNINGLEVIHFDRTMNDSTYSTGYRTKVKWPNPEREGETLQREIRTYLHRGHIVVDHNDDVLYTNTSKELPLKVQYHTEYGPHGKVAVGESDIDAFVDATMAEIDDLMSKPPVRETILPDDLRCLHEFRLSEISPHVKDVVGMDVESLYVYARKDNNGKSGYTYVKASCERNTEHDQFPYTAITLDKNVFTPTWEIDARSEIGDGLLVESTAGPYDWRRELDNIRRTFGEFIEGEYYRTAVSDLNNQNEIQQ